MCAHNRGCGGTSWWVDGGWVVGGWVEGGWRVDRGWVAPLASSMQGFPQHPAAAASRGPSHGGRWLPLLSANASFSIPVFVLGDQGEKGPRGLTGQSDPGI